MAAVKKAKAKLTLGDEIIEFAESLKVGEGQLVGKPLVLMDWQKKWLKEVFDHKRRRAMLSVGRRNGKTALVSVIVLAALFGPLMIPQSRIQSASRSREQAAVVFSYALKMLQVSGLMHLVHVREAAKEIDVPQFGTSYRAVSAEATTAVGFGSRLVIHDELGQVRGPRDALYEALSSGMGTYADSLEIVISTQAPGSDDLFSLLLDDALAGHDPGNYALVFAAEEGCDLLDEKAWQASNPSLGAVRDLSDLRRLAEEAKRLPSREAAFRNYNLNQRVSGTAAFLTPSIWNACGGPVDEEVLRDGPVYAGLDLSARNDLTALSLVAKDHEGVWHIKQFAWTPGSTLEPRARRDRAPYDVWRDQGYLEAPMGASLDYAFLAQRLSEILSDYPALTVGFDRWRIDELKRELEKLGVDLPLVEVGQGFKDMTVAVDLMEQLALQGKLRHGGNPLLRWCVSNVAVSRDPAGNRKPDKAKAWGRIDAAVSLLIALRTTVNEEEKAVSASDLIFV